MLQHYAVSQLLLLAHHVHQVGALLLLLAACVGWAVGCQFDAMFSAVVKPLVALLFTML